MDRRTDGQTDRRTGRQTVRQTDAHTHISNHLPEPSPSVEVSQYRAVCARHQILHEGESKRRQEIKAVGNNCIPTRNCQCSKQHPCMHVYIYQHIPFLRLRLNSQPPILASTQISCFLCAWSLHSPSPNYQSSHPHVFKYLSLLTISSLWPPDLPLCAPGREGR